MRPEVKRDLTRSADAFVRIVWPAISDICGGGELIPVEGVTEEGFAHALDAESGIDGWQHVVGHGIRGIASRVQWGKNWRSFTIRESRTSGSTTELSKRLAMLRDGGDWLLPALTVQAYLNPLTDELNGAGIVRTRDLYKYISENRNCVTRTNPDDGNTFVVVFWDDMNRAGYRVIEVP